MSNSEVTVRLNPLLYDWYRARAAVEEELKAIGKALERIRISSQLQDAFIAHLLAVHRQWCEKCPPTATGEPGPPAGGLERESCTQIHARAAADEASNPMKHQNSVSFVSTFTQTTDMNGHRPQMNTQGEVDDNNDDISEIFVPSSMTCRMEDEESQADVNRTLEKPSTEKGVGTEFIKLEVLEDDQFQDTRLPVLLKLEKDHCDVDVESRNKERPRQRHGEEVPPQHIKSDGHFHLERTNTVLDHLIRHERDSQGHHDLDMAGNSSEAVSHQGPVEEIPLDRSDETNSTVSSLNCDVLSQEEVFKDPCLDSYMTVQKTSRTDDGTNNSTLHCDFLSPGEVSTDQFPASLASYKNVEETSDSDGKMRFYCSICSISYSCVNEYQKHLSTHTCQKPYQCSVCSKAFSRKDSFDTHVMKHKGGKHFKCDHCSYQCSTEETLNVHIKKHTYAGGMSYTCSFCNKIFYHRRDMERHMVIHSLEKPFKCDYCNYRYGKKSNLKVHMRVHTGTVERPYKCDYCTHSFATKQHLEIHMRTHSGEKPYSCDTCDYRCSQKGHLAIHMRVHTGQNPHGCPICGKRFLRPSGLKRHMIVHTGQKPHHCSLCGKNFAQSGDLNRHMMIHTGKKPHQCSLCGSRFIQSSDLKRHMVRVHTVQGISRKSQK